MAASKVLWAAAMVGSALLCLRIGEEGVRRAKRGSAALEALVRVARGTAKPAEGTLVLVADPETGAVLSQEPGPPHFPDLVGLELSRLGRPALGGPAFSRHDAPSASTRMYGRHFLVGSHRVKGTWRLALRPM